MEAVRRWAVPGIAYQDLEFSQVRAKFYSRIAAPEVRWVDVGMPRIPTAITSSVVYLYGLNPKTGEIDGPCGTGCIISVPEERPRGNPHHYAVTNWHVAVRDGASIIRLNRQDGNTRFIHRDPSEWTYDKNGDDLAVTRIDLDPERDLVSHIPQDLFVTPKFIERYHVRFGEDVFMVGLFAGHDGGEQNIPKGRFGNISMMATDLAPVDQPNRVTRPCHIIDLRSRTGFSGSPVFSYRTPASDLTAFDEGGEWTVRTQNNMYLRLLGIHCRQFFEPLEVSRLKEEAGESLGDPIKEGDLLEIQSSMTAVIPAWRISELLEDSELTKTRKEIEAKRPVKDWPRGEAIPRSEEEIARLRDEGLRRALNTPPKPRGKKSDSR